MKRVVVVSILLSFAVSAREGKTVFQERAERAKNNPVFRASCCEIRPVVCAMEDQRGEKITDEQRDLMRMHNLSVPPVIRRELKIAEQAPIFSAAIPPIREIEVSTNKLFIPIELTIKREVKKEVVKAEVIEDVDHEVFEQFFPTPQPKLEPVVDDRRSGSKITDLQREIMQRDHLDLPPVIIGPSDTVGAKLPDVGVAAEKIKVAVVEELNDENFNEKIAKGVCIVEFGASWCGPCKRMKPIFEAVMSQYSEKIVAFKVDVDNCPIAKKNNGVSGVPVFVIFENGRMKHSRAGAMPREEFERWIQSQK